MALFEPQEPSRGGRLRAIAIALALLATPIVAWRACQSIPDLPDDSFEPPVDQAPSGEPPTEGVARPTLALPPRCTQVSSEPFVIGDAPPPRPEPAPDAALPDDDDADDYDELAPFAVEIGRGTAYDGGFAAGTLRSAEGGTVAALVTLGRDGRGGKLVRLTRSRGDLDPPVATGFGASVLVALLEPNAAGRTIKIVKVTGEDVTWGAELSEGRDESMAVDLAVSGSRAAVVWDEVARGEDRSRIMLSSFDAATLRSVTASRPITPPKVDAEAPRLIARPGGYWMAYAAVGQEPKPKKLGKGDKDDDDNAPAGEAIPPRWVEVVPLDESGAATATARSVTPKEGHVLAFDLELARDGGAMIAWRDDDTPSGSSGGRVSSVLVSLGGLGEPHVLAEDGTGSGVPELLPGWLALSSISGATQIAPITADAQMKGPLAREPSLGNGEPLAATADAILLARPAGRAVKLTVMRCSDAPAPAADAAAKAP